MVRTAKKLAQTAIGSSDNLVNTLSTASALLSSVIKLTSTKTVVFGDDNGGGLWARVETINGDDTITQGLKYTINSLTCISYSAVALTTTKFAISYSVGGVLYAVIGDENDGVLTFGTPQTIITGSATLYGQCLKITDSTILFASRESGYNNIVAGSVSGTVITLGTVIPYSLVATGGVLNLGLLDANTAILTYVTTAAPTAVTNAILINISGTTLSLRNPIVDTTANNAGNSIVRLDDNTIFVAWQNLQLMTYVYGMVGIIANGIITYGNKTTLCTAETPQSGNNNFDICALSATDVFLAYTENATTIKAVVCSVSGTTITPNTAASITTASLANKLISTIMLTSTLAVIGYSSTATAGFAVACTISGTTITAGSVTSINSIISATPIYIKKLSTTSFLAVTSATGSDLRVRACTISGTTITAGSKVSMVLRSNTANCVDIVALDTTHAVIMWRQDDTNAVYARPMTIADTIITEGTTQTLTDFGTASNEAQLKMVLLDPTHIAVYFCEATANNQYYVRVFSIDGSYVLTQIDKKIIYGHDFGYASAGARSIIQLSSTYLVAFSGYTMKATLFKCSTTTFYTNSCIATIMATNGCNTPIAVLDSSKSIIHGYNGASGSYPIAHCIVIKDYVLTIGFIAYLKAVVQTSSNCLVLPLTATTAIAFYNKTTANPYKISASILTIDNDGNITQGTEYEILSNTNGFSRSGAVALSSTKIMYVTSATGIYNWVINIDNGVIGSAVTTPILTGVADGHTEISSLYFANPNDVDAVIKLYAHGTGSNPANLIDTFTVTANTTTAKLKPNSPIIINAGETLRVSNTNQSGNVTVTAYGMEVV